MKQGKRITICLVAGVLILAISAGAAFGSVSGYARYKEAVKALALEADNFTASANVVLTYDGTKVLSAGVDYAVDGANYSQHSTTSTEPDGTATEDYFAYVDGVRRDFYADSTTYNEYVYTAETDPYANSAAKGLLGIDGDEELNQRIITFAELAVDTVVGELKNNFVQVGKTDGVTQYQVEIAKNQVPSLINAGLSLMAYSVAADEGYNWGVEYENYQATMLTNYEKDTGETLSQEFKDKYCHYYQGWEDVDETDMDWYNANYDAISKVETWDGETSWEEPYWQQLEDKDTGILYVRSDGTSIFYADWRAFADAHPEEAGTSLSTYMGEDMTLEKVLCTFGVDEDGNLVANDLTADFTTVDSDGKSHSVSVALSATLSDYGATTVQLPDPGDRTKNEVETDLNAEVDVETTEVES